MKTLPLLLLLSAGSALADDAALLRCRAMTDISARVDCYDAIPVAAGATVPPAAAAAVVAPAATAPSWAALPAKPAAKVEAPRQPDTVETSIEGAFKGWGPGQQIRLANGQVWRVEDSSSEDTDLTNPKAKLRKGMLGAVYLDIEGAYRAPRVKRVQ
jgi:hypothetical protein